MSMTRIEHLLVILTEECAEVSQRCAKALRFGLTEIQPGHEASNAARIEDELVDLLAVIDMLEDEGAFSVAGFTIQYDTTRKKREKVDRYLDYSRECGTLSEEPRDGVR